METEDRRPTKAACPNGTRAAGELAKLCPVETSIEHGLGKKGSASFCTDVCGEAAYPKSESRSMECCSAVEPLIEESAAPSPLPNIGPATPPNQNNTPQKPGRPGRRR